MTTRKKNAGTPTVAHLLVSRQDARKALTLQIEKGSEIELAVSRKSRSVEQLEAEEKKYRQYNATLLEKLFAGGDIRSAFDATQSWGSYSARRVGNRWMGEIETTVRTGPSDWELLERNVSKQVRYLESVLERIGLFDEPEEASKDRASANIVKSRVFVVHGHDPRYQAVARLIEKLGLDAVVLKEQPSEGRTIMEKLEAQSDVGFAVVLFTPDDLGSASKSGAEVLGRARQNVVFELGYFVGKLGRKHVALLYVDGTETPSDLSGVVYIPLDSNEAWAYLLVKELKAAGYKVSADSI